MPGNVRKLRDEDTNPCIEEGDASKKCLEANNYNKNMCSYYFLRYKMCRKFWNDVTVQRRRSGVKPEMPTAKERKEILEDYQEKPY
ncbi:coiled-coil-helix-coiled-coil-helix domain-containing protein 7 [Hypanus sabinus]|uniref:coiled-coil-helix-coiled-coil-helix domain-containing protein 7 n=1 Tax=Hypanus sabinus TaxID=79690 RepID=UPI0028C46114|nr:coiled-coil-helix-coiled-coil-helix domain-containing protein 7 [Hypanus sabinus]XP_059837198.1 coiled-coil-helix-coiled-coil-helix domain-containing protein 7 [Hypanus sabinus]XP_059837199.1 coiled-coil-helix-coiled-coil-helix domain-containing protein 7 [Hypanus sabinus]XP_059837200.1 coiled-coil-helix-coiled-coil-helix domain-containing protein 7 [Hypanus sabinus]